MKFHFYIIYSDYLNRYYVGHTSDLEDRIKKHNANHKGFTGKSKDWELKYAESFIQERKLTPGNCK